MTFLFVLLQLAGHLFAQAPASAPALSQSLPAATTVAAAIGDDGAPEPAAPRPPEWFKPLRGVHMTGWAAGSAKNRRQIINHLRLAGLNAVTIALKEYDGLMFVRDVRLSRETGAFVNAIPDLAACARDFKDAGIYTIARIVLFKDNNLARKRPDLAVKRPDGRLWTNANGVAWVDPYKKEIWEYNLAIASRAAAAGFDEIQFDYVRFPSDGNTRLCRYSRPDHSGATAQAALVEFLSAARRRLRPMGVKLSACVFGMTTSDDSGMGIGQHIAELARQVDFVAPMMYPSHYNKGIYGVKNPNREPYKMIFRGLRDAVGRLGEESWRLRPYLQDFSLGYRYRAEQVRAQILAAAGRGVQSWTLWNPQNHYTWTALRLNNRPIHAAGRDRAP
ncbi:MAG: putative glycoside hydrolase [Elusimicrobia bacterium]|nr:putative glycoside hydrolase [Elusimicrobiota bacterium]